MDFTINFKSPGIDVPETFEKVISLYSPGSIFKKEGFNASFIGITCRETLNHIVFSGTRVLKEKGWDYTVTVSAISGRSLHFGCKEFLEETLAVPFISFEPNRAVIDVRDIPLQEVSLLFLILRGDIPQLTERGYTENRLKNTFDKKNYGFRSYFDPTDLFCIYLENKDFFRKNFLYSSGHNGIRTYMENFMKTNKIKKDVMNFLLGRFLPEGKSIEFGSDCSFVVE